MQKDDGAQQLREQIADLKKENSQLRSKSKGQEHSITGYKKQLEEIDYNLRLIENSLSRAAHFSERSGREVPSEERIKARIALIEQLIRNSNLKIKQLDSSMDELRIKESEKAQSLRSIEKTIKASTKDLIFAEEEFGRVLDSLSLTEAEVKILYDNQLKITMSLNELLTRAYFFEGTEMELREAGLVDEEGSYIGISEAKVLNAKRPIFSKINKKADSFDFKLTDKVSLLSPHPVQSYIIRSTVNKKIFFIKDRKAFWSEGNYLVIQTTKR